MSGRGGAIGAWGAKVHQFGDDVYQQGARVFGARVTSYEAAQGASSNVLGYAVDDKNQSGWDYVRHGFVGSAIPDLGVKGR